MENQFTKENNGEIKSFSSHGKLLLTGEYLVLKGAKCLALATQPQQSLRIEPTENDYYSWTATDEKGNTWLNLKFVINNSSIEIIETSDHKRTKPLMDLMALIYASKPELFTNTLSFFTQLEFNPHWGLGTSSTLIANLAKWAELDPFYLLKETFGGSGYDIAVAMTGENLTFTSNGQIDTLPVRFEPPFSDHLWFVYLNKKTNSREAITDFKEKWGNHEPSNVVEQVTSITNRTLEAQSLEEFEDLMLEHETVLSDILNEPTVREQHFPDYKYGIIKSLGAWGGDFVLVTGTEEEVDYFRRCGYETIIPFKELILS